MRRAIASLCVCWLGWCVSAPSKEPSNTTPLAFGMTRTQAEAALGVPLRRLAGHAGMYYATGPVGIPGYYPTNSALALQFRGGRLTGWKQDWSLPRKFYN
jgi:hypothetical protein